MEGDTLKKQEKQDKSKGRSGKLDGYFSVSKFCIHISWKYSPMSAKLLTPRMCHHAHEGIAVKGVAVKGLVTVLY